MKIIYALFQLLAPLLFLPLSAADAAENAVRDYPADRIAAHTYVIHGPLGEPSVANQGFMNNPGFVITDNGVVVIDPGSSLETGRMVLRQIRKITRKPVTHVLDTHVHGDHWLGNQAMLEAYPKAQLMAHPEMIRKAHAGEAEVWTGLMDRLTQGYTKGTHAVIPAVAVTENQRFTTGGVTFHILAPENAHSKTDIMIEVIQDAVMFTGDNVLNRRIARLDDGSFKGSIAACDRAIAIKAKSYVPGHGKTADARMVKSYRDYMATLMAEVQRQYDAGKSDFEMKETVATRLGAYKDWSGFDEQLGKHISLAVLEIEAI
ncbi:MAG TPA: MBL fold metallo-hydrolase [Sulfuriferula sp.]|nr:MBL fold metallo-hydrolase [Sulfuriferula sp.]